jgi:hypothetical protein
MLIRVGVSALTERLSRATQQSKRNSLRLHVGTNAAEESAEGTVVITCACLRVRTWRACVRACMCVRTCACVHACARSHA